MPFFLIWLLCLNALCVARTHGQSPIRPAEDAPKPMPPEESLNHFLVPDGFAVDLIAAEPLIREPTGVCWDASGRLYVSELHGYNLEGHLDVQELNETGVLDTQVRRIPANERAREQAMKETFGTIKRLSDLDGDGRMDSGSVFADRLPPVYGICPALDGIIAACAPDIVYLADRDGDGRAEVREVLFTGFQTGVLERGINQPQWGLDHWIYFGKGHGGGTITGPHLEGPVNLYGSDFRIKPDGSAIEPVTGRTHTFGHAFTEGGDRFTSTTSVPGLFVTPIPWRYLIRNPNAISPSTERSAGDYQRVFPASKPHPWRVKRAEDPAFFKFYRDRYGAGDSDPGGWFTSACGPLIYQDGAWPEAYRGNYFVCEPAQNFVHRARILRDGPLLRLQRFPEEEASEFLRSTDRWFHPISLAHGPEGAVYICDFYREIIEDYSAIPRYLQQQYGLVAGRNYGRIWRLRHTQSRIAPEPDMSALSVKELVRNVASPHSWRRQSARRLLIERRAVDAALVLRGLLGEEHSTGALLNIACTLDGLNALTEADVARLLGHSDPEIRRQGLRLAEPWLDEEGALSDRTLELANDSNGAVALQAALTLGESNRPRAMEGLASLVENRIEVPWMEDAVLSGLKGRELAFMEWLPQAGKSKEEASKFMSSLFRTLASSASSSEISRAVTTIASIRDEQTLRACLEGMLSGLDKDASFDLDDESSASLKFLLESEREDIRTLAGRVLPYADPDARRHWVEQSIRSVGDSGLPPLTRLGAVQMLALEDSSEAAEALINGWPSNTPRLRAAILEALFSRNDRLPVVIDAMEKGVLPASALTAFQRVKLMEHDDERIRERASALFQRVNHAWDGEFEAYAQALSMETDSRQGREVFEEHCASCHRAHGIGAMVGPDLTAEFQRAEETILKDILLPNETISAGYSTYEIETNQGALYSGVLTEESANHVTLALPSGMMQTLSRRSVVRIQPHAVSLMPENLAEALAPAEMAAVIHWLRSGGEEHSPDPSTKVLFDEEADFIEQLKDGGGRASLYREDAAAGGVSLRIEPFQRHNARMPGWDYPIRENPGAREFRYLRLAWKSLEGDGAMIELSASGGWPDAVRPTRRYYAGRNTTDWKAIEVSPNRPEQWRTATLDLWKDAGDFNLTGIAPTAMGGPALFDRIELLRVLTPSENR